MATTADAGVLEVATLNVRYRVRQGARLDTPEPVARAASWLGDFSRMAALTLAGWLLPG